MSGLNRLLLIVAAVMTLFGGISSLRAEGDSPGQVPEGDQSSPRHDISPEKAALLGFVPGLGQIMLGNVGAGTFQSFLFLGSLSAGGAVANNKEYIYSEDRTVTYNLSDIMIGHEIAKQGILYPSNPGAIFYYSPLPLESAQQRDLRLLKNGSIGEMNPLIQYGEYSRTNTRTEMADSYALMAQSTLFYSVYSSYRDAGRGRSDERLQDLLAAPFRWEYLSSPWVLVPLAFLGMSLHVSPPSQTTIVNNHFMTDGTREFLSVYRSMNAAVAEEAFFRGYVNDLATRNYGPWAGGFMSGTLFGVAHLVNGGPGLGVLPQMAAGYYFSFLQYKNQGDIREGIALHFWWDFFIFVAEFQAYRADSRFSMGQKEVSFMPLSYTMRF